LPDFVTEASEERPGDPGASVERSGWEAIVFQVEDEPESDLSTAAIAP
jgi:hypothetical protein